LLARRTIGTVHTVSTSRTIGTVHTVSTSRAHYASGTRPAVGAATGEHHRRGQRQG
jgi:hypothetical protein